MRKDLAAVSGAGKPRIGYVTGDLIRILESHLGHEKITSAILVGAGKLGCALLDYDGFEAYGVKIVAAFDCNEKLVNTAKFNIEIIEYRPLLSLFFNTEIMPMDMLNSFCSENNIKLGIITVGEKSAQQVCNQMISSGITAIWNFAPCGLKVPGGILLKQENLALSLAYLNNQLCK